MEMTKVDENIQTAQNMLSGIVERCYELEEKNKDLGEENSLLRHLRRENQEYIEQQREKIKILESRVRFLEGIIDQKTRDGF